MNGVKDLGTRAPARIKCRVNMISDEKNLELQGYIVVVLGCNDAKGYHVMTKEKCKCHRGAGTHSPAAGDQDRPEFLTPLISPHSPPQDYDP